MDVIDERMTEIARDADKAIEVMRCKLIHNRNYLIPELLEEFKTLVATVINQTYQAMRPEEEILYSVPIAEKKEVGGEWL